MFRILSKKLCVFIDFLRSQNARVKDDIWKRPNEIALLNALSWKLISIVVAAGK